MFRLLVLVAALLPTAVAGQPLTLAPRADANEGLPPSVRVFDVSRAGTSLRASLVRATLAADDWALEAVLSDQGTETVPSFAQDDGVLAAVNGGYFGGGQSYSLVLNDGVVAAPNIRALTRSGTTFYPTRGAFALSAARVPDVAWVYDIDGVTWAYPVPSPNAPGAPQPRPDPTFPAGGAVLDAETAIGGGPVLVQNGAPAITYDEEVFFGGSGVDLTSRRARTAVGYTGGSDAAVLIVAVPESAGMTLGELAQLLVDLGADEALNLDGGGSTAMSAGGVALVASTRPVASALRLRTPGDDPEPETGTVIDTGDDAYRETGAWFESSNTPFYGATPSRLNEVGQGDDRAVFSFGDIAAGRYAVEAWWVPASNRATDAPFTVYAGGAGTTVRVDQTDAATAGRWNEIGTFSLAPGDSLVVTDAATGAQSPAYVSVDAVRLTRMGGTATEAGPTSGAAVRVWPNPASRSVTVARDAGGGGPLELVDALGRVLRRWDAPAGAVRVDLDGIPVGVYVVRETATGASARFTVVR